MFSRRYFKDFIKSIYCPSIRALADFRSYGNHSASTGMTAMSLQGLVTVSASCTHELSDG